MTQRRRRRTARRRSSTRPSPAGKPRARLKVHAAADFVELIPYLLGFHPVESLVLMLIHDGEVRLTARADLSEEVEALRDVVRVAARRCRAELVFLAAYSAVPSADEVLHTLVHDPTLPGVVDAVRVDQGRWWSVLDGESGRLSGSGRLAAEAVFAGLTAAPTRAAAVSAASGPPADEVPQLLADAERQSAAVAGLSAEQRADEAVATVARRLADTSAWSCADRLRLAALVDSDVAVRDAVLLRMTQRDADAAVRLWSEVVGCAPPGYDVAPLCLLGLAAWLSGNGALVVECVERAGAADPRCTLAALLAQIVDAAVPPEAWSPIADDMEAGVPR